MIIIKVALSKDCKNRIASQNDVILLLNICETVRICFTTIIGTEFPPPFDHKYN